MILACCCDYVGEPREADGSPVCPRCARPCLPDRPWVRTPVPRKIEQELRALLGDEPCAT